MTKSSQISIIFTPWDSQKFYFWFKASKKKQDLHWQNTSMMTVRDVCETIDREIRQAHQT